MLGKVAAGYGVVQVIRLETTSFSSFSFEPKRNVLDAGCLTPDLNLCSGLKPKNVLRISTYTCLSNSTGYVVETVQQISLLLAVSIFF